MIRIVTIKFLGFLFIFSTIALPQGGKLTFTNDKIYRVENTSYINTLKLLELSGKHGLKALQFRLSFNDSNILEFINLSKGKDIDSPEWSLQYNVINDPDNSSNVIVYALLYNVSTGELPTGTYDDFIRYEYRIKNLSEDGQLCSIKMSEINGSWFDGTDANISSDSLQIIFITAKEKNKTSSELFQNFPNPFNPETVISYFLPEDNFIKIIIYNSLGEKVTTVVDEFQKEGIYSINYKAPADLPSGVYFCILEWKDFVLSKKILLVK